MLRLNKPAAIVGVGTAAIGGSVFLFPHSALEIVVLGSGVAILSAGAMLLGRAGWGLDGARLAAGIGTIGVVATVLVLNGTEVLGRPLFTVSFLAGVTLAAAAFALPDMRREWFLALWITTALVIGVAAFSTLDVAPDIDVVDLHEQAATALADGRNPYTTGNVAVRESRPGAGQELIEEYTYPPVVLGLYSVGYWLSGDSRITGAVAVALSTLLVGSFGLMAQANRDRPAERRRAALASVALVVANPSAFFVVVNGMTEAVTLPLFMGAGVLWRRFPTASAICLGLALGSKQYLVLALPAVLALGGELARRRAAVAGGTAFLTALPFLVWDPGGFVNGVIVHHLTRDPRPDSATLAGVDVIVPTAIAVSLAILVGIAIAWRRSGAGIMLLATSASVAVFTFLAIRGFGNTWYLVAGLVATAVLFPALRHNEASSSDTATVGRARVEAIS